MHWLYFSENSPRTLQKAGFSYDSTFGYNDGVGFRAGTAQAFCPPGAEYLLELPLHIQDTALFYPGRMKLSESDALDCCTRLTQFVSLFGGALTINWHTRSLSPERLWGDFYARLLDQIQDYRVWFATAEQVIRWFRMRRELRFDQVEFRGNSLHVKMSGVKLDGRQPPFVLRVHHPKFRPSNSSALETELPPYSDIAWKGNAELIIQAQAG